MINFDLPKFAEDYVHRIGRTGRAGASGTAISFASVSDLGALQRIQRYIGSSLPQHVLPGLEPTRSLEVRNAGGNRRPGNGQNRKGQRPGGSDWKGGGKGRFAGQKGAGPKRQKREPIIEYRSR